MTNPAITSFDGEYSWLSNFFYTDIYYDGLYYYTSEHAFQAAKVAPEDRAQFQTGTPGQAKRLGKKVKLVWADRAEWDRRKDGVMRDILRIKFKPNSPLAEMLLTTGDAHLEEGNNRGDKYWGTVDGVGQNKLGLLLMQVREELRQTNK